MKLFFEPGVRGMFFYVFDGLKLGGMMSLTFVQNLFREYYAKDFFLNDKFMRIEKREFGFASFEGWMLRHKGFKNREELTSFLQNYVPRDVYFSCAYYEDPKAEMEKKGWLGADLIFDIDADHIPTPCERVHDKWICGNCGFAGKGNTPEKCPLCGSEKFNVNTWPCEICLASAKKETIKLLDILQKDFGFSEKEIRVFFSGHRGYHVHVESEAIKTLDAIARKEIVDYVSGLGLDVGFHGLSEYKRRTMHAYRNLYLSDFGWGNRIVKGIQDFILNAKEQDLKSIGIKKSAVEAILQNKDAILKSWIDTGTWGVVKNVGFKTWKKIAEHGIKLQSAKIDTVVTTDTHRLIRLAGTLHGKTGFKKVEFAISAIDDFDPFKEAIAFKNGMTTVFVHDSPKFRIGDMAYGPYKQQKVKLQTAAAMLLVCKNRAEVVK